MTVSVTEHARFTTKTKLYAVSLLGITVSTVLITTTQMIARTFGYASGLGDPLFNNIYSPLKAIPWSSQISKSYPDQLNQAWIAGIGTGALVLLLGSVSYAAMTFTKKKKLEGHGSAQWARRPEVVDAGLLDANAKDTSLIIGGWEEKNGKISYLIHTGPESCLLYAPARSGKGVALVVPILLSYSKSCLVLDVKGELWDQTAGYRKEGLGNKVLFHDPSSMDKGNARFNAIDEIRTGTPLAVKDAQMIAEYVIPTEGVENGGGGNTEHFKRAARSLIVGVMLYECYQALDTEEVVNIPHILSVLSSPDLTPRDYLENMRRFEDEDCSCLGVIRETASEMLNREAKEFSSVLSCVITPLTKFRDPILAGATAKSDFRISDLVENDVPVTLYLTIRPSDRDVLSSYFALIVNLVCRRMTEKLPNKDNPRHELLLMLDEFSSLPPLPIVQQSMDVMPGYGVKAFIVLQDYESLKRLYSESETISSNCKVTIAYTPNKFKTAELLSSMVGVKTVEEKTVSKQKKLMSMDGNSESEGLHSRALLTPDEIMRIPVPKVDEQYRMIEPGQSLVFSRGCHPIRAIQTPWFFDKEMTARASVKAPEISDRING